MSLDEGRTTFERRNGVGEDPPVWGVVDETLTVRSRPDGGPRLD